ncbi:hypothetical protein GCM10009864_20030 [Streptomyces lunalinharesii]|uniref:Uncharacterized protein n=1 Tax=Streptomyces lunalinharesii TaxID=333384 RepID=A0ABN3RKV8_9ACTN
MTHKEGDLLRRHDAACQHLRGEAGERLLADAADIGVSAMAGTTPFTVTPYGPSRTGPNQAAGYRPAS